MREASRVSRLSLLPSAAWSRKGLSAAVFAAGVVTICAAAIGPLYARAARESVLTDALRAAPPAEAGISYTFTTDVSGDGGVAYALKKVRQPRRLAGFGPGIAGVTVPDRLVASVRARQFPSATDLVWRDGQCHHLVIVSGHCPSGPGQLLVSQRSLGQGDGWKLGGTLVIGATASSGSDPGPAAPTATIVGTYRPRSTGDPYWFGQPFFDPHASTLIGAAVVDPVFVTPRLLQALPYPATAQASVDYPVAPGQVRLGDVSRIRSEVAALRARYPVDATDIAAPAPVFATGIGTVFATADRGGDQARTGSLIVTVQLALLAWLVLFQVIGDAIEARAGEIALAKVRGLRPLDTLRFGLAEPLLLLVAAVPFAVLAAVLVVRVMAGQWLAAGTPTLLSWPVLWAVLAGFAGGCAAIATAARRVLTRPVLEQWRQTGRRRRSRRAGAVVDVVVAAAAVAGLVALRSTEDHRSSSPVSLLAPGLLVLAVALLGVRLLPLLSRAVIAATAASRHVGTFLASRQVARRPVALRFAAVVAVAVGLASFALAGEGVAQGNRQQRAAAELGAVRVLSVQLEPGHDPVQATHEADPDGRWAMAAAEWLPDGGDTVTGTVLAVDADRLPAVMSRARGLPDPSALRRRLRAQGLPALTVDGDRLRARVSTSDLHGTEPPTLVFDLSVPGQPTLPVSAQRLRNGDGVYDARVPCTARTCTLTGLSWERGLNSFVTESGTVLVTAIEQHRSDGWHPLPARLGEPGAWRSADPPGQASDRLSAGPAGLRDEFENDNGASASIQYAQWPERLGMIASSGGITPAAAGGSRSGRVVDSSGATLELRLTRVVPLLPVVLSDGVLADLEPVLQQLPSFSAEADWQVWLGPAAPADAVRLLTDHGLIVQGRQSAAQRADALAREGPALALKLLLACAVAAVLLAIAATVIAVVGSSRRRAFELAALRVVGVRRAALVRASFLEQLTLLGTALVLGVPAGWAAARLVMSAIPEYSRPTPLPAGYVPAVTPVVILFAALAGLLAAAALAAALALIHAAVPGRLREAGP